MTRVLVAEFRHRCLDVVLPARPPAGRPAHGSAVAALTDPGCALPATLYLAEGLRTLLGGIFGEEIPLHTLACFVGDVGSSFWALAEGVAVDSGPAAGSGSTPGICSLSEQPRDSSPSSSSSSVGHQVGGGMRSC